MVWSKAFPLLLGLSLLLSPKGGHADTPEAYAPVLQKLVASCGEDTSCLKCVKDADLKALVAVRSKDGATHFVLSARTLRESSTGCKQTPTTTPKETSKADYFFDTVVHPMCQLDQEIENASILVKAEEAKRSPNLSFIQGLRETIRKDKGSLSKMFPLYAKGRRHPWVSWHEECGTAEENP